MIATSIRAVFDTIRDRALAPFRAAPPAPRIHIVEPTPGTAIEPPVRVSGVGCASQEGYLGVIVRDATGSQIGFARARVDARTGEFGPFAADVDFDAADPGKPGRVEVYDESPRDRQLVYLATVEITFR